MDQSEDLQEFRVATKVYYKKYRMKNGGLIETEVKK